MKKTGSLIAATIFLIFTAIACGKSGQTILPAIYTDTTHSPADTLHHDSLINYSYLALGDSYTIGQSVSASDRFPAQTAQLLASENIKADSLLYIATTGWTTSNLLSSIASQNPSPHYDIVTLLIGVNDQYQGVDTATYRARFIQCLQKAVQLAANRPDRVFVLSIPDYSATPFVPASDKARVSMEIDWFNAINKQVTWQYNIAYIDITPSTRLAAIDPSLIANDGLHPSGKEYAVWAQMLAPFIRKALK